MSRYESLTPFPFLKDNGVDNQTLVQINAEIREHLIEEVGQELRAAMNGMQAIASA